MDWLSLAITGLAVGLLLLLSRLQRKGPARLRPIPGLARLYRAFGLSVEDGTRLLVSLGSRAFLTKDAGLSLAGLALLRRVAQKASLSDRPPVAVAGESVVGLLAQDTLQSGYRAAGAAEYFQPVSGRVAGLTPFSSAAATMQILGDEDVSVATLIGNFGPEAGLLAEVAERRGALLIGATGDPGAQSILYATSSESLIGEELFAAPAYLVGEPVAVASLNVQDILRWLIILGLIAGVALKILGLY